MKIKSSLHRWIVRLGVVAVALSGVSYLVLPGTQAAAITNRSITLINTGSAANQQGSAASATVNTKFTFTPNASSETIGSMRFTFCNAITTSPMTSCTGAGGTFTTTGATLQSTTFTGIPGTWSTGNLGTAGFTVAAASGQSYVGGTAVTLQLNGVTNPTSTGTYWVQIETYAATTPGSMGSGQDVGVVAFAIVPQITVSGYMPESLVFCVGVTVTATCSSQTGTAVSLGTFSATSTVSSTSMFGVSTNAGSGYAVTYTGDTLKSGSNSITAMSSATTSSPGSSQFGLNLMSNSGGAPCPTVGAAVNPANNGTNYNGNPVAGYNTSCTFKYTVTTTANAGGVGGGTAPDTIANSTSGATKTSDGQAYTVSYMANVSGSQPAGTYSTTITYVATATF